MASPYANKNFVIRASTVLTTSEVNGLSFVLTKSWSQHVSLDCRFTLGSLTNVVIRFYVSMDQVTWVPVEARGGVASLTLTSSQNISTDVFAPGWSYLMVSAQGTGTVTGSALSVTARYMTRAV